MWTEYWLGRLYFTEAELGSLTEWETGLKYCGFAMFGAYYTAIVLVAGLSCVLSRRRISGFKWACIACAMCAVHGAFFYTILTPHNFTLGFTNQMHWIAALLPLGVAFLLWWKLRSAANSTCARYCQDGSFPPVAPLAAAGRFAQNKFAESDHCHHQPPARGTRGFPYLPDRIWIITTTIADPAQKRPPATLSPAKTRRNNWQTSRVEGAITTDTLNLNEKHPVLSYNTSN